MDNMNDKGHFGPVSTNNNTERFSESRNSYFAQEVTDFVSFT
jgi:hypothetical protein